MLKDILNKADTLQSRVHELQTEQGHIERELADAKSAVIAARQAVDRSEEKLVLGSGSQKDCDMARNELATCEQTVSEVTQRLASHRAVAVRAASMLASAEQQAKLDQNTDLDNECKSWLLELAESMVDYYLLSSRGEELRKRTVAAGWYRSRLDGGISVPTACAMGAWGELTNLHAVISRLREIQSVCGTLPDNAVALIQAAELTERNAAAGRAAQRELDVMAHKRQMAQREAALFAKPLIFDFTDQAPEKRQELKKQLAAADPAALCPECAGEGRIREGQPRKLKTDTGTRTAIKCDEHARRIPALT